MRRNFRRDHLERDAQIGAAGIEGGQLLAKRQAKTARRWLILRRLLIGRRGLRGRLIGQRLLRAFRRAQAITDRAANRQADGEQHKHAGNDRENLLAAEAVFRLRPNAVHPDNSPARTVFVAVLASVVVLEFVAVLPTFCTPPFTIETP